MATQIPAWLISMINAEFNTTQKQKEDEKGYFCVDCGGESLTKREKEKLHDGHKVLQAYNTSRKYGYKRKDVLKELKFGSRALDVSKVRPFAINNGFVYFPKSRSDNGAHKKNIGRPGCCKTCGYRIDSYMYCSIMCQLTMEPVMNSDDIGEDLGNKKKRKMELPDLLDAVNHSIRADSNANANANANPNANANKVGFRKRSRKGIPHRAPFF